MKLLPDADLTRTVAWHQGRALSLGALLADASALAPRFPAHGQPVNLCQDRYLFSVGLLAAQLRGRPCLLPPNALPSTLAQLQLGSDAPPFVLTDDDEVLAALRAGALTVLPLAHAAGAATPGPQAVPAVPAVLAVPAVPAVPDIDGDRAAFCLLTSGSTGQPTAHPKSWRTAAQITAAGVASLSAHLSTSLGRQGVQGLQGLSLVATVPPQHSYGIESSILLALLGGAAFACGRPFYPADVAAALAQVPRPRALVTTPFHLKAVVQAGVKLPPVDLILSATAPLSPQLAQQAESGLGWPLIEIYGCTEAGQVATRRTTQTDVWQTMGALRLQAGQVQDGIVVQGGHVAVPTPLADRMELLDARHFRLLGRANDLVHVAGKRSSLGHLNYHLNRIAGVQDGAFCQPQEDADGVGRLVAFVVAPGVSARQIVQALRPVVDAAFLPRRVVHLAALPREATGKLTAGTLRALAQQALGATAPDGSAPGASAP